MRRLLEGDLISMWILKGAALFRVWRLFEARRLLVEIRSWRVFARRDMKISSNEGDYLVIEVRIKRIKRISCEILSVAKNYFELRRLSNYGKSNYRELTVIE